MCHTKSLCTIVLASVMDINWNSKENLYLENSKENLYLELEILCQYSHASVTVMDLSLLAARFCMCNWN